MTDSLIAPNLTITGAVRCASPVCWGCRAPWIVWPRESDPINSTSRRRPGRPHILPDGSEVV